MFSPIYSAMVVACAAEEGVGEAKMRRPRCSGERGSVREAEGREEGQGRRLTHLDEKGRARMVDVGGKAVTRRVAVARGVLWVGEAAGMLISEGKVEKGDVFAVARVAGIMAAKATSSIVPLCHQVSLSSVKVDFHLDRDAWEVRVIASASCEGSTGVEMEALLAASVACLTIYDMVKAVAGRSGMAVREIRLLRKMGGRKGDYFWDGDAS